MITWVENAEIMMNKVLTPSIYQMVCKAPRIAAIAKPGQFVNVKYMAGSTFLRRPFGIANADPTTGTITIMYRVVGQGTNEMKTLLPTSVISVEGPLGKGIFSIDREHSLLIGGGMGAAPLLFLAKKIKHPIVLISAKNKEETFWTHLFSAYTDIIYTTTDDGSVGIHGFATAALPFIFKQHTVGHIAVCGPTPMMQAVAREAMLHNIDCEVSLEKRMACGFGVCLGCTFTGKVAGIRYKVCSDGPVFSSREVFL
ncbi:dihydroorotate dehydrogenase electron transfer subunit [uncultured Megasphaera sp.]|uniref:dihydroorotate dehydrogenase electron transfer subunit n=1 Tax=uncultured Megasphaera sp. TaxID=165188 RepID=UPI0025939152|nr:dihydroorotate dehydrogenase electron transfer subunit [uncultured Megasphaera sp.]